MRIAFNTYHILIWLVYLMGFYLMNNLGNYLFGGFMIFLFAFGMFHKQFIEERMLKMEKRIMSSCLQNPPKQ